MSNDETKTAIEQLICAMFIEMLDLARAHGITIKRMRELLPNAQLRALEAAGLSQLEIMADSGYTRKWIRKILIDPVPDDNASPLEKFVSDWSADTEFPDVLALDGTFPSFADLCDRYAGDFTPPSLLKMLIERGVINVESGVVHLSQNRMITTRIGPEMIQAAQTSLTALFGTLKHNLSGKEPPFIERRLWSDRVAPADVPDLRDKVRQINHEHYQKILQALAEFQVSETNNLKADYPVVGMGMYWFERET